MVSENKWPFFTEGLLPSFQFLFSFSLLLILEKKEIDIFYVDFLLFSKFNNTFFNHFYFLLFQAIPSFLTIFPFFLVTFPYFKTKNRVSILKSTGICLKVKNLYAACLLQNVIIKLENFPFLTNIWLQEVTIWLQVTKKSWKIRKSHF